MRSKTVDDPDGWIGWRPMRTRHTFVNVVKHGLSLAVTIVLLVAIVTPYGRSHFDAAFALDALLVGIYVLLFSRELIEGSWRGFGGDRDSPLLKPMAIMLGIFFVTYGAVSLISGLH